MYKYLFKNNHTNTAIIIFVVGFALVVAIKPNFLFNKDGSIRNFGLGRSNKTILPLWLIAIILAILAYLIVIYYKSFII